MLIILRLFFKKKREPAVQTGAVWGLEECRKGLMNVVVYWNLTHTQDQIKNISTVWIFFKSLVSSSALFEIQTPWSTPLRTNIKITDCITTVTLLYTSDLVSALSPSCSQNSILH